jgi:quercetin dioxygenase-like cupin family protein
MTEHPVVDPVFGMRSRFWRSRDEDGGEVQHIETVLDDGGGVTPHIHPSMEERFTVLAGRMEFLSGRTWIEAGEGETVVVPPGTRHAFRNRSGAASTFTCEARPPSSLQAFLEEAARMSREGKLFRVGLPKPKGLLDAAMLIEGHRDMVTMLFPAPPKPLQRVIFGPLARLANGSRSGARQRRRARA